MPIGLIGIGRMGGAMARNLLAAGEALAVYDLRPEATAALKGGGATIADSPAALAEISDIILTSLPSPAAIEKVIEEIAASLRRSALVIETSTKSPDQSRALAARVADAGGAYLDAPISGGQAGADAGTLTIMVGSEKAALERALPVLRIIGRDIHHMGPVGTGDAMKLVIQSITMSYFAMFMEGVAFGEALGIPLEKQLAVLGASSADAPSLATRYDQILADDRTPRFEISSALKDLSLVDVASRDAAFGGLIAHAAREAYAMAEKAGLGADDLTALRHAYGDK